MKSNYLITTLLRGKWFIDHRLDVETSEIIDKILDRQFAGHTGILSDTKPYSYSILSHGGAIPVTDELPDNIPNDTTAVFLIEGTMLKHGSLSHYGTTEMAAVIKKAAEHKKVSNIIIRFDSGGGSVDSIAPLVEAIQLAQMRGKPVIASCDLCASAAYFVASYCDEIHADNDISAEFGSIGVMVSFRDYQKYYENQGVKEHRVYSNLSEHKNEPLELALKGKYDLIKSEMLDPLASKFQEEVLRNLPELKKETVGILSGKTFYAADALENGMIHAIGELDYSIARARKIKQERLINKYTNS